MIQISKDSCKKNLIRERAARYGVDTLTSEELLLLLSSKKNISLEEILSIDIIDFFNSNPIEYLEIYFGENALLIKSICELYKRKVKSSVRTITSPHDVYLLLDELQYQKKEHLIALLIDTKDKLIKKDVISIGDLNTSIANPREIFCNAVKFSAARIIIAHNHPSGDPTPSKDDISISNRIKEVGKLLAIPLSDSVIIGKERYVSFKELGYI